ncbi:oligoendopeptidase F [Haploplasma modicum]|uniref:oligoendopeptidase F n=1 Tax=Haploplasma modicum TaxID=2150 RepID=UPI00047ACC92|nr:oligoendopeptidase F [Haploplasma modicum]
MKKILKRNELNINDTWDLTRLFKTEQDYLEALNLLNRLVDSFKENYENKINDSKTLIKSIKDYEEILKLMTYTGTYQSLHSSVDISSEENLKRQGEYSILASDLDIKLTFYNSNLLMLDELLINEAIKLDITYESFLNDLIIEKKHMIDPKVSQALSEFSDVFSAPYANYQMFKFADMKFEEFKVLDKSFKQSFTLFENEWQYELNHDVRRAAFESFYKELSNYENGLANNYRTKVLTEKAYSNLKGYDSVIDYLLVNQKVSKDMYDRQIDLIMEHLSGPMRKFARLLKDIYSLDKMTYADLHLPVDYEFEPEISIEKSKEYAKEALSVYGSEYSNLVNDALNNRWIDFPQNVGKSTGGFCSSPYNKGSYILLNWNNKMDEVFVLAHELGHAGHFYFAGKNQTILNTRSSLYMIEAPSTINELIMADYLSKERNDLRFRRWVLSNLISRTYYHNFVTHLLEAAYQREVYRYVDAKKPLNAKVLKTLKLNVLKDFWKDDVEINDYAGLTWMRQPHYFMGLYPYTYSAGLTISTLAFNKIKNNEISFNDWINMLSAGGSKKPLELAKMVDIDLETDKPLLDTIKIISDIIDEIEDITKKLKS